MMASWLSGKVILVLFSNDCLCVSLNHGKNGNGKLGNGKLGNGKKGNR